MRPEKAILSPGAVTGRCSVFAEHSAGPQPPRSPSPGRSPSPPGAVWGAPSATSPPGCSPGDSRRAEPKQSPGPDQGGEGAGLEGSTPARLCGCASGCARPAPSAAPSLPTVPEGTARKGFLPALGPLNSPQTPSCRPPPEQGTSLRSGRRPEEMPTRRPL